MQFDSQKYKKMKLIECLVLISFMILVFYFAYFAQNSALLIFCSGVTIGLSLAFTLQLTYLKNKKGVSQC